MTEAPSSNPDPNHKAPAGEETRPGTRVVARLYGEPMTELPEGLYIPPDALEVILDRFEGPLDLLLWLIRSQKFDVMDIPMTKLTEQYMAYVELIRRSNLELASAYLVMSATLMSIKSRMLLPKRPDASEGEEAEDPRAELMRRLLEYERMREAAKLLDELPRLDRDFLVPAGGFFDVPVKDLPVITPAELSLAWEAVEADAALSANHHVTREELSVREHMTGILKILQGKDYVRLTDLMGDEADQPQLTVWLLASLELAKVFLIQIQQAESYSPVYLRNDDRAFMVYEEAPSTDKEKTPEELEAEWKEFFEGIQMPGTQGTLF